jgi:predicted permease
MREWLARIIDWFRRGRLDAELAEELRFHQTQLERDERATGKPTQDAAHAARRRLGNVTRIREDARERWSVPWLDNRVQDLRYAIRGLGRSRAFTLVVALTLALGIGANAAIFSVVDRLLFRPPPMLAEVDLTHRVYVASTVRGKETFESSIPFPRYSDITRWTTSFARTAEYADLRLAIGAGDEAREMQVGVVSASFFGFFDAPPALGRYFSAREDSPPNGTPVVVLSYAMWRVRYGGRSDVLGSTLQIGSKTYTIIGVAPRGFVGLSPDQPPVAFIPTSAYAASVWPENPRDRWWTTYVWGRGDMIVQRKPGVTVADANADLTRAVLRSYQAELDARRRGQPIATLRPHGLVAPILNERGPNQSSVAKVAALVGGMALIVLLIACANVANLLLARALRRRREIAVRLALGVTWRRLLSQLLIESMLLALLGGAAGLLVAQWGGSALRAALLPRGATAPVMGDARTLVGVGIAVVMVGILTGLAPAWQARRTDLTRDLKAGAREGSMHNSRVRVALLVLQGALSVVLLVGSGLFVRSLQNVRSVRLGYDVDPVLMVTMNMRGVVLDSAKAVALRERLMAAAQRTPGVEHVALTQSLPFWNSWKVGIHVAGIDSVGRIGQFYLNAVTPDYFATMGTRILRGRGIGPQDVVDAPRVVVVSSSMAKALWPGQDALGQCIKVRSEKMPCTYVVGVAEDIKSQTLSDDPGLNYYLSAMQYMPDLTGLLVRTRGDAASQAESIRRALQKEMPGASYIGTTPFTEILGDQIRSWDIGARMFVVFGGLSLVLATIGLYGVIAYNVTQRSHEIGVRIALGASMPDVVWLVVRQGVLLAVLGIVIGGAVALASAGWVTPLLFDESPRDPLIYAAVTAAMLVVAVTASFIPARRAARVDPNVALRAE